jgi:tellurite resistance protein TehA-like permease
MQNLRTWKFWFNLRPELLLPTFQKIYLAILLILLILAIFSYFKQTKKSLYKRFWKQFYVFSFSNLVIGAIFFFFNYERAAFLSARFWLALWGISMLIWLVYLIKIYRQVPLNKKRLEEEQEYKKYIP